MSMPLDIGLVKEETTIKAWDSRLQNFLEVTNQLIFSSPPDVLKLDKLDKSLFKRQSHVKSLGNCFDNVSVLLKQEQIFLAKCNFLNIISIGCNQLNDIELEWVNNFSDKVIKDLYIYHADIIEPLVKEFKKIKKTHTDYIKLNEKCEKAQTLLAKKYSEKAHSNFKSLEHNFLATKAEYESSAEKIKNLSIDSKKFHLMKLYCMWELASLQANYHRKSIIALTDLEEKIRTMKRA